MDYEKEAIKLRQKKEDIAFNCAKHKLDNALKKKFGDRTDVTWEEQISFYEDKIPKDHEGPMDDNLIRIQTLIICRERLRQLILMGFLFAKSLDEMAHFYFTIINLEQYYFNGNVYGHNYGPNWDVPPNPFSLHHKCHSENHCLYCNHQGSHTWIEREKCLYCFLEKLPNQIIDNDIYHAATGPMVN